MPYHKSPENDRLREAIKAAGNVVEFMTAYMRVRSGWSIARAVSVPPHKKGTPKEMKRGRGRGRPAVDVAPLDIKTLREAFCDHFMKTGGFDQDMLGKLRSYVNERRKSGQGAQRVSAEHRSRDPVRGLFRSSDAAGSHSLDPAQPQSE